MSATTPSTEDRVWAVLSHLSALAFGMGIFLPIVGWSDQRRKSNYASFQNLQALGYQSLGFTIWILSYLVIFIAVLIVLAAVSFQAEKTGQSFDPFFGPGAILLFSVVFGFFAIYFLLPIIASVACALGKDFRYPVLGDRLARYLKYDLTQMPEESLWLNEDHECRWVAAKGHFSILIILWGMLAPLTTWILEGKHSILLKFQSIQALVYQVVTTVVYLIGGLLYLFGFLFLIVGMGGIGEPNLNSSMRIVSIVIFGASLLVSFVLILLVPFLHILGQWAGYRVLKGYDYRYPLIGKLVEKWIVDKTPLSEDSS
jgi:uncharacterized Tic20 family protein